MSSIVSLVYCMCGTPLLRETRYHLTAEAWARAYESGDPHAMIQLEAHHRYHVWFPHLLRPDGTYETVAETIETCPACQRLLIESVVTQENHSY